MTKKIGIIIGIILMMSFLSGLSATTLTIHNTWVGTNDDLIITCDGFLVPGHTIVIKAKDIHDNQVIINATVTVSCVAYIQQGNRVITVILPSASSNIDNVDATLPGPWQEFPLPIEER